MGHSQTRLAIDPDQTQYARCRTAWQGHDWDDAPAVPGVQRPSPAWVLVGFRCTRCGTRKTYLFNPRTGETSRPYYSHRPQNYKAPGVTRDDWKRLFVTQYQRSNGGV